MPLFRSLPAPLPARRTRRLTLAVALGLAVGLAACDHGLAPPDEPPTGTIRALITYVGPSPPDSLIYDLRFVAMRFVPQDTADFLQLDRMAISPGLRRPLPEADTVIVPSVDAGVFLYSGVAHKFGRGLLDWRPVGLYQATDGIFEVRPEDTTDVPVTVDFRSPPPFPPTSSPSSE